MTDYTVFPNAPIVEALLDIRAKLPKKVSSEHFLSLYEPIKDRYTKKTERKFVKGAFAIGPEPTATVDDSGSTGYFFESSSEKKVFQARLDGFTFNKLKPYECWASFRDEAHYLWDLYCDLANPEEIPRIALRYINRIEVPTPINDFGDYIATNPQVAPGLPQEVMHFFMQLVLPKDEIGATARITQTMEKHTPEGKLPLILDIDVWCEGQFADNAFEMWNKVEMLRNFKNDIFFKTTTDKAKELFK